MTAWLVPSLSLQQSKKEKNWRLLGRRCYTTSRNRVESDTEREEVPVEDDHFQTSSRALQLLLRSRPNLPVLKLERHEMDVDFVEEEEWVCEALCHLRVRIQGLDDTLDI